MDTLSRAHLSDIDDNTITEDSAIMIHTVALNLPISQTKMQTFKESTINDPQLVMLKEYIEKGCWPEQRKRADSLVQPFWHVRFDIHLIEGIVMKDNKIVIPPTDMQQYILSIIHSAHLGIDKCKARARNAVY